MSAYASCDSAQPASAPAAEDALIILAKLHP